MKLAEWAELKDIYLRCRKQPNQQLFKRENFRRLWPMWLAAASTIALVSLAVLGMWKPKLVPYTYAALAPWALALLLTRQRALRTVYPQQFAEHAIDRYFFLGKENMLCYAFFLEAVRGAGYTATRLRNLSGYADLMGKPQKPMLSQNLGFATLLAFMIAVSLEVVKGSAFLVPAKGWAFMVLGIAVLFVYWLVLDGIHSIAHERVWIKRYVDMATFDLDESL